MNAMANLQLWTKRNNSCHCNSDNPEIAVLENTFSILNHFRIFFFNNRHLNMIPSVTFSYTQRSTIPEFMFH